MNAKIDAQIARSRVLAEEAARVSAEATQTTATVTSSDGRVTVVAQPTGAIAEVRLSSAVDDAIALGATITDTIAAAQRAAADAVVESLAQTLGADSGLVDAVRRDVQVAFPAPGDDTLGYR
ncbi:MULTISPECIES: YbaB/EbfC family nucleoid-associated protein [unclassified Microbacterium]|uniref:YbaB/EbfC family nucleoid-associated protein n=1 Tax=unclassified Microbacterium TaxID=2609290 RepID=UPI0016574740|nr:MULTISPECIES: YbaB/EbfC family nucleoid-associated protein [unclassified Microbacterium]MCZ0711240.1 YbaB/EbfC family nucleoid-associated protein [Microbacterium paraoxydans]MCT1375735.1 YbaB/EbfC family nucleoid-associated protein [Microbacterium sp. p3-SID337]MDH5131905.1 YbaB/EbfC family nucleoid-associated protein [Microbacterium sp. RD10]MDH5135832.1 YbaB/EbfC family nucleoid-associated protein [Microbacterium sp. RD11]MDH5146359.1 YbaB/EbfC family nucleoid-associated protein [Microbac